MTLADEIDVEVKGSRIRRVSIPNNWSSKGSLAELEAELNKQVSAALPDPVPTRSASGTPIRHDITVSDLAELMAMQQEWREALNDFKRRESAGEFTDPLPNEIVDDKERLSITFVAGRFNAIHFHPEWAAKATAQSLCDAILEVTEELDLLRLDKRHAAQQHVRELDANIRRFTS